MLDLDQVFDRQQLVGLRRRFRPACRGDAENDENDENEAAKSSKFPHHILPIASSSVGKAPDSPFTLDESVGFVGLKTDDLFLVSVRPANGDGGELLIPESEVLLFRMSGQVAGAALNGAPDLLASLGHQHQPGPNGVPIAAPRGISNQL